MEGGPNIQECDSERLIEEENISGCVNLFCHPKRSLHRFIALVFMCFLGFGSYFCYDNPASLEDHMKEDLNITTTQYTMLYSIYSWPNVVLCSIGGYLLDRVFGIRWGTILYMGLTLTGQLIFTFGVMFNWYWVMVCGRFIFGIGAESLAVAQNSYAVLWFKGKELNMVFGLQLSFARMGSTVNFLVMEGIYNWVHKEYTGPKGLGLALLIATTTCLLSMVCAMVLGVLDSRAERILQRNDNISGETVRLTDIKDFKSTFWLITVICVTYYVAIFPFITVAKEFFMDRFHMSKQDANNVSSLVYLISGIASPVFGLFIDKIGKNVSWISIAVLATILSHVLLGFTELNPYVGVVIMGLSYSTLASSLWPLVSLLIPEYQLGTAYGVCQAIQNLGLAVISIITGLIVDNWGYKVLEIFFVCSLGFAFISTLGLWILDRLQNGILNLTPKARQLLQNSQNDEQTEEILSNTSDDNVAGITGEINPNFNI